MIRKEILKTIIKLFNKLLNTEFGEVAEWLKAHAWKACIGFTLSRVRIPLSPPFKDV